MKAWCKNGNEVINVGKIMDSWTTGSCQDVGRFVRALLAWTNLEKHNLITIML